MKCRGVISVFFLFLISLSSYSQSKSLLGAGATFPEPLYSRMFSEYYKIYGVAVNYQPIGSGGGIRQLISKTIDFGATDVPLTEEEEREAGEKIVHIPVCIGAVVVVFNLPGITSIKLTPEVIADIFLGKITKWDDERISSLNPDIKLPNLPILVVRRSDGSGTTYIFSDYLSGVSTEWKEKVGKGKSLNWPAGIGGKGNAGVTAYVKQTPGAIGYVEKAYATQNRLGVVAIKNKAGVFVLPELKNIMASANQKISDLKFSLLNSRSKDAYPLSSFTWIIVYRELSNVAKDIEKAREIKKLLLWMINDGQKYAQFYDFAPLPEDLVKIVEKEIKSLTFKGKLDF